MNETIKKIIIDNTGLDVEEVKNIKDYEYEITFDVVTPTEIIPAGAMKVKDKLVIKPII